MIAEPTDSTTTPEPATRARTALPAIVERRRAAAAWLASQGFGIVHVPAPTPGGDCTCPASSSTRVKQPGRRCSSPGKHPSGGDWQHRSATDAATAAALIGGPQDQFGVLPLPGTGLLVVDEDVPGSFPGEIETFTVATSFAGARRKRHLYLRLPAGIAEADVPKVWPGGEIRRAGSGHVVGPWSRHVSGVDYEPNDVRTIAEIPSEVIEALRAAGDAGKATQQAAAADPDWQWRDDMGSRHEHLRDKIRTWRGTGLIGGALREAARGYRDRHLLTKDRPITDDEIERLAAGAEGKFADDAPPIRIETDAEAATRRPAGIDAADLLDLELAPLRWIVPDLLPEGTTIVASPPKVGKSCLVYQVVTEVAVGGELLGRRTATGACLYYALEDGQRRGQERLRAALAGRTMPRGRLEVRWSAPKLGHGLEEELERWLDEHPDAAVVAIDTLGKVRPATTGRRNQYELDVEDLGRIQAIFRDRPTGLLVVHHARKDGTGDDFLASVSGTYGITGSADTIIAIQRKRLEAFGRILVTGRDVPDAELAVRFDGLTWHDAPASLPAASAERMEVYRAIEAHGPIFAKALGDLIDLSRTSVQNMIAALVQSGAVARTTKGYVVASAPRARAPYVPHDSGDSDSHWSHGGYPREDPVLWIVPDEPEGLMADAVRPPCFADPAEYRAHGAAHYRLPDGWGCRTCEAQTVAVPGVEL